MRMVFELRLLQMLSLVSVLFSLQMFKRLPGTAFCLPHTHSHLVFLCAAFTLAFKVKFKLDETGNEPSSLHVTRYT